LAWRSASGRPRLSLEDGVLAFIPLEPRDRCGGRVDVLGVMTYVLAQ
jgi:hypothetical protein